MSWLPKDTVLVPIDFSDESTQAIQTALQLVDRPASVHVIHVLVPLDAASPIAMWGAIDDESRQASARTCMSTFLGERECSGVTVAVKSGDPGLKITEYAKECDADLIVIPSHGYHGIKRILLGSTAERVLRHAECPVLVLRRSDAS